LFGDNPSHFDLIYIGALSLSCVFCWKDKDTLGALVILLGLWGLSRLLYILPDSLYTLPFVYIFCCVTSLCCLTQTTAKITLIITIYSSGAEVLWWWIDYVDKPQVHYFVGLLAITVLARELLLKRVFILSEYFGFISGKIALDWQIKNVLLVGYLLVLLMVLEYFVRHLGGFKDVTFVYYSFSFIGTIISGITLALIYMHYFYNQSKKHLTA
jgi:hypothetical protein